MWLVPFRTWKAEGSAASAGEPVGADERVAEGGQGEDQVAHRAPLRRSRPLRHCPTIFFRFIDEGIKCSPLLFMTS